MNEQQEFICLVLTGNQFSDNFKNLPKVKGDYNTVVPSAPNLLHNPNATCAKSYLFVSSSIGKYA